MNAPLLWRLADLPALFDVLDDESLRHMARGLWNAAALTETMAPERYVLERLRTVLNRRINQAKERIKALGRVARDAEGEALEDARQALAEAEGRLTGLRLQLASLEEALSG